MNIRFPLANVGLTLALMQTASVLPVAAQQKVLPTAQQQSTGGSQDGDDTDVDFNNAPLPVKYAHGFSSLTLLLTRRPSPPEDPQERARYCQAEELRSQGTAYLFAGRPSKAIARLLQARALWPASAATYRWLAEAYTADGHTAEAIANYRLLFYGLPGQVTPDNDPQPKDKPREYGQAAPEQNDPTLLLQFSLLLQKSGQYAEAQTAYDQGMRALSERLPSSSGPLPPLSSATLTAPAALEAATRIALAINQVSYQDKDGAKQNIEQALQIQPGLALALYYQAQLVRSAH